MTEHVYITPDKKISMLPRNCVEIGLPDDLDDSMNGEIIGYLESHFKGDGSVYPNPDCGQAEFDMGAKIEGFFWIPNSREVLEETYEDAPEPIKDALLGAFLRAENAGASDYGYALIGFF